MLLKYLRLLRAFANAFWILWFTFPRASRDEKLAHIQAWSTHVLTIMGVRVHVAASATRHSPTQPQLLVANHISWLDVLLIQSLQPSVFVAKSEVRDWPVVGAIAQACGVVFVDRGSTSSTRQMVADVVNALQQGYCVAGFPEGSSSEGHEVGLFHANLFEAAIHCDVLVQPLGLRYTDAHTQERCSKVAFVGDLGFVASLHQVMGASPIDACVRMGKTLSPQGHSRRTLAHLSHRSVVAQCALMQG